MLAGGTGWATDPEVAVEGVLEGDGSCRSFLQGVDKMYGPELFSL